MSGIYAEKPSLIAMGFYIISNPFYIEVFSLLRFAVSKMRILQ